MPNTATYYIYHPDPARAKYRTLKTQPLLTLSSQTRPCVADYRLMAMLQRSRDENPFAVIRACGLKILPEYTERPVTHGDVIVREVDRQITAIWVDNPYRLPKFEPADFCFRTLNDFFKVYRRNDTKTDSEDEQYLRGYRQAILDINTPKPVVIPGRYENSVCPQCGKDFNELEENMDGIPARAVGLTRCPYCGQKLDWTDITKGV